MGTADIAFFVLAGVARWTSSSPCSPCPSRSATAPACPAPTWSPTWCWRCSPRATPVRHGSQVGSHHRPTSGHTEPPRAFDFCGSLGIKQQSAASTDGGDLVRIEGVKQSPEAARYYSRGFTERDDPDAAGSGM